MALPAGLTRRQADALLAIQQHHLEDDCSPSLADIARRLRSSKTAAHQLVAHLQEKGCIRKAPGCYRNLIVSDAGRQAIKLLLAEAN